jgi:hypothetical protein
MRERLPVEGKALEGDASARRRDDDRRYRRRPNAETR